MKRELIRGNSRLAARLGVHRNTVTAWRAGGLLAPAIVAECGRVIVYDLGKVQECLTMKPRKPGRPRIY